MANVAFTIGATVVATCFKLLAQSGNVPKSEYTMAPHVGNVIQTTSKVKIVGPIPAFICKIRHNFILKTESECGSMIFQLTISLVRICDTPATIAFGGVPTGIWNAIQQDKAAGNIRYNGCISIAMDISARTGSIIFAMATFDVNSVKVCAAKHTMNSSNNGGRSFRPIKEFPSIADMPDRLPPSANAKPPPNKKIKLHGTLALIYFHVMSPCDGAVGSVAAKKTFDWSKSTNLN